MRCTAMQRVMEMEQLFDFLKKAWEDDPESFWHDLIIQIRLKKLMRYYGRKWIQDYLADEKGAFPPDMKRGVLSQDGVWNFLCDLEEGKDGIAGQTGV